MLVAMFYSIARVILDVIATSHFSEVDLRVEVPPLRCAPAKVA